MTDRLDSRALRQFLAVAETLSFRQAAEVLHMSQPPLSRAVRQMEARLGTPLFERNTQRVVLTPAGQRLLPYARRILQLIAQAQDAVAAHTAALGDSGRVLLRPSGTEPVVRVMVEAASQADAERIAEDLADVVRARLAIDDAA